MKIYRNVFFKSVLPPNQTFQGFQLRRIQSSEDFSLGENHDFISVAVFVSFEDGNYRHVKNGTIE